jgi:hypothetical protein
MALLHDDLHCSDCAGLGILPIEYQKRHAKQYMRPLYPPFGLGGLRECWEKYGAAVEFRTLLPADANELIWS